MKIVSPDQTFIYYAVVRRDGKTQGIRVGRSVGAMGFVTDTSLGEFQRGLPAISHAYDTANAPLGVERATLPPMLLNALAILEADHPEIDGLLTGRISFDEALRS
jgi:hypothetical protein